MRDPKNLIRPDHERIPEELAKLNRWILWKLEKKEGKEELDKVPYHPDGYHIDAHKPENWMSFDDTCRAYEEFYPKFSGVGFVPAGRDKIVGLDWDDCMNGDGKPNPETLKEIHAINSYTEVSPSGEGVRAFALGDIPSDGKKDDDAGFEIYKNGRFLTVTGRCLPGMPTDVENSAGAILVLYEKYFGPKTDAKTSTTTDALFDEISGDKSHDALLRLAARLISKGVSREDALEIGPDIIKARVRSDKQESRLKEWPRMVESAIAKYAPDDAAPKSDILKAVSMGIDEFRTLPIPERKSYLHPWLKEESVVLIAGERGIGKSNCALGILDAVTRGSGFGPWECDAAAPCLYFDAEMPRGELQERITKMSIERQTPLHILSSGQFTANGYSAPNLMDEKWRDAFRAFLNESGVKLWVLDNLASAAPGRDEISKKDYDPLNQWFLALRHDGITTIVMAHTGYDKTHVRGSSGQEDNVNMSIVLQKPPDYNELDGCRFNLKFTKKRVDTKDLHLCAEYEFKMVEHDGLFTWEHRSAATSKMKYILEGIEAKIPYDDICRDVGLSSKSRITQIKQEAIDKGWMTPGGKIRQSFYANEGVQF